MVKSYSLYFLGVLAGRVASIILLPIYTSYLTPRDYGVLEILSMMLVFASIVFGDRVGHAFFREWGCADTEEDKRLAYGSAIAISSILSISGVVILVSISGYLSEWQFGSREFDFLVKIFSFNLFLNVVRGTALSSLRAMDKAGLYLFFSVLLLALQILFNLKVLVDMRLGLSGVVYASVLASLLVTLAVNIYAWVRVRPLFSVSRMSQMINFSWPIIVAGIFMYVVVYADRYFIRVYQGLDSVGIYALGYKFGFILFSMIWGPFKSAWDTEKYVIYKQEDRHSYYKDIFRIMYLTLMGFGIGMIFWVDDFLYYSADRSFLPAYDIVPVVVAAYIVFALTDFVTFGILLEAKTKHFSVVAIYSALLSLLLYWFMIPRYGILGGAYATFIVFFYRYMVLRRKSTMYFDMRLDEKRLLVDSVVLAGIAGSYLLYKRTVPDVYLSVTFSVLLIVVFFLLGHKSIGRVFEYSKKKTCS